MPSQLTLGPDYEPMTREARIKMAARYARLCRWLGFTGHARKFEDYAVREIMDAGELAMEQTERK